MRLGRDVRGRSMGRRKLARSAGTAIGRRRRLGVFPALALVSAAALTIGPGASGAPGVFSLDRLRLSGRAPRTTSTRRATGSFPRAASIQARTIERSSRTELGSSATGLRRASPPPSSRPLTTRTRSRRVIPSRGGLDVLASPVLDVRLLRQRDEDGDQDLLRRQSDAVQQLRRDDRAEQFSSRRHGLRRRRGDAAGRVGLQRLLDRAFGCRRLRQHRGRGPAGRRLGGQAPPRAAEVSFGTGPALRGSNGIASRTTSSARAPTSRARTKGRGSSGSS